MPVDALSSGCPCLAAYQVLCWRLSQHQVHGRLLPLLLMLMLPVLLCCQFSGMTWSGSNTCCACSFHPSICYWARYGPASTLDKHQGCMLTVAAQLPLLRG